MYIVASGKFLNMLCMQAATTAFTSPNGCKPVKILSQYPPILIDLHVGPTNVNVPNQATYIHIHSSAGSHR